MKGIDFIYPEILIMFLLSSCSNTNDYRSHISPGEIENTEERRGLLPYGYVVSDDHGYIYREENVRNFRIIHDSSGTVEKQEEVTIADIRLTGMIDTGTYEHSLILRKKSPDSADPKIKSLTIEMHPSTAKIIGEPGSNELLRKIAIQTQKLGYRIVSKDDRNSAVNETFIKQTNTTERLSANNLTPADANLRIALGPIVSLSADPRLSHYKTALSSQLVSMESSEEVWSDNLIIEAVWDSRLPVAEYQAKMLLDLQNTFCDFIPRESPNRIESELQLSN